MLTLLSPAKKMNMDPAQTGLDKTHPRFGEDTKTLAKLAKTKSPKRNHSRMMILALRKITCGYCLVYTAF